MVPCRVRTARRRGWSGWKAGGGRGATVEGKGIVAEKPGNSRQTEIAVEHGAPPGDFALRETRATALAKHGQGALLRVAGEGLVQPLAEFLGGSLPTGDLFIAFEDVEILGKAPHEILFLLGQFFPEV